MQKRARRADLRFSGGASSAWAPRDGRLDAIVNRLDCTGPLGWLNIMKYATAEECVGTYAQLCVAFGPGAQKKWKVFFVRSGEVMAFLSPEERVRVFSLVSTQALRGAAALKRSAKFGKPRFAPVGAELVLADGSLALDRVETASIRFPALEDVMVCLWGDLCDNKGFTDARRAPILAKLCTFTFITKLYLLRNDIAVLPDAANASIGALTNLKFLDLGGNKIATLPDSVGRLTALETLHLYNNILTAVPASIGSLTSLTYLLLHNNRIATLPTTIGSLTALTVLSLDHNRIATLPTTIGGMTSLKVLCLSGNQLTTLPASIGRLTTLKTLAISRNNLIALPQSIGQLTGLERLHLSYNNLTTLPESIVSLTNLRKLDLSDIPGLIRTAQSPAIQAWLQAYENSPTCLFNIGFR